MKKKKGTVPFKKVQRDGKTLGAERFAVSIKKPVGVGYSEVGRDESGYSSHC